MRAVVRYEDTWKYLRESLMETYEAHLNRFLFVRENLKGEPWSVLKVLGQEAAFRDVHDMITFRVLGNREVIEFDRELCVLIEEKSKQVFRKPLFFFKKRYVWRKAYLKGLHSAKKVFDKEYNGLYENAF